jgi:hypothetical protein
MVEAIEETVEQTADALPTERSSDSKSLPSFRIVAQSAGVSTSATSTESAIEITMVIENWR